MNLNLHFYPNRIADIKRTTCPFGKTFRKALCRAFYAQETGETLYYVFVSSDLTVLVFNNQYQPVPVSPQQTADILAHFADKYAYLDRADYVDGTDHYDTEDYYLKEMSAEDCFRVTESVCNQRDDGIWTPGFHENIPVLPNDSAKPAKPVRGLLDNQFTVIFPFLLQSADSTSNIALVMTKECISACFLKENKTIPVSDELLMTLTFYASFVHGSVQSAYRQLVRAEALAADTPVPNSLQLRPHLLDIFSKPVWSQLLARCLFAEIQ